MVSNLPGIKSAWGHTRPLVENILSGRSQGLVYLPVLIVAALLLAAFNLGCDSAKAPTIATPTTLATLEVADVQTLIAHGVEQAERLNVKASIAVLDREGNVLGVFRMTGAPGPDTTVTNPIVGAIAKARSAAYLSSNQHGFSTLTACFITRNHFPPDIGNTAAGPLFGVPRSSIGEGDIQPNGDILAGGPPRGQQGLTGVPGGVPIFKNGLLAGGYGVSTGLPKQADLETILRSCGGNIELKDEIIALGGVLGGFETPANLRGDGILIDGIRFLFSNADPPAANFTPNFSLNGRGAFDSRFQIRRTPNPKFPQTAANELFQEVNLGGRFNFTIRAGTALTSVDVRQIITQAATQSAKTRAAIRRPPGVPMQVFISVVDVNGAVLGIGRTPDATLFSFDVSAQKARTAVAFSNPNHPLGQSVRTTLGIPSTQGFAISARAVGFLAQDFYPPGISREEQSLDQPIGPGPFFKMPPMPPDGQEFIFQRDLQDFGLNLFGPNRGNGITIFPGGAPLYKNGQLAGGVGISGDGVDQDDLVTFAGALGFEPPPEIRCDQFMFRGVRLPYVKFPRQPELR